MFVSNISNPVCKIKTKIICMIALLLVAMLIPSKAFGRDELALAQDTKLDLFLLAGQSNMAGRGKVEAQDKKVDPHVWMFTKTNAWAPAIDPLHFDKKIAGVGPGRTFGIAVAEADPRVNVGLVPCAVGGTSIDQWKKGGKLYTEAIDRAKAAMAQGTFKAILWHQGESDANPNKAKLYAAKLTKLIADFRSDLGLPELPFIVGELGPFHEKTSPGTDAFNAQLESFAKTEANCACVSSEGLTSIGDNTHFDAASQREFGRRYAAAYLAMTHSSPTVQH
jgi:hypothetical protein